MTITLYDNKYTKDTLKLFDLTMEEYNIKWQPVLYIEADGKYAFNLALTTHRQIQGLKKFKKRAMVLINGNNGRMHPGSILIPKKYNRPINTHYVETTVENIMKYI